MIEPLAWCTALTLLAGWVGLVELAYTAEVMAASYSLPLVIVSLLGLVVTVAWSLFLALEITDLGRERQSRRWLLPVVQLWAAAPLAARLIGAHLAFVIFDPGDQRWPLMASILFATLVLGFTGKSALRLVHALTGVSESQRMSFWALGAALPRTGWWVISTQARKRAFAALHVTATEVLIDAAAISGFTFASAAVRPLAALALLSWLTSHHTAWRAQRE